MADMVSGKQNITLMNGLHITTDITRLIRQGMNLSSKADMRKHKQTYVDDVVSLAIAAFPDFQLETLKLVHTPGKLMEYKAPGFAVLAAYGVVSTKGVYFTEKYVSHEKDFETFETKDQSTKSKWRNVNDWISEMKVGTDYVGAILQLYAPRQNQVINPDLILVKGAGVFVPRLIVPFRMPTAEAKDVEYLFCK